MSRKTSLNVRYRNALPVHPTVLPELVPHNPVSWVFFLVSYFRTYNLLKKIRVEFKDGLFIVNDVNDMNSLWSDGFFGKGVLSRSEPSWAERTSKRLGLGEFNKLTVEEVTALRRDERRKFKKERSKLEAKQAELKKKGIVDPLIEEKLNLKTLRDKDIEVSLERETYIRDEDSAIIEVNGQLKQIETVQLQPEEAFFLKFALNSVDIIDNGKQLTSNDLLGKISNMTVDDSFLLKYVAYHHYRSLGWCVRSGIKFGTDYLLYKRGPPFSHAEFALVILPNYNDETRDQEISKDFVWLSNLNRVVGGVRKNLVLVFVDIPKQSDFSANVNDIPSLLSLYTVNEVLYRRWVANKNRD